MHLDEKDTWEELFDQMSAEERRAMWRKIRLLARRHARQGRLSAKHLQASYRRITKRLYSPLEK